jgi:hypothetical protein
MSLFLKDEQGLTRSARSRAVQNPRLSSNQAMVDALLATSVGTLPMRVAT